MAFMVVNIIHKIGHTPDAKSGSGFVVVEIKLAWAWVSVMKHTEAPCQKHPISQQYK